MSRITLPVRFGIPSEAEYVAQDAEGRWHWFSERPEAINGSWHYESGLAVGENIYICYPNPAWASTLRRVK